MSAERKTGAPTAPQGPDGTSSGEKPLDELVRLGEHVIKDQLRVSEEQDAKLRHLLTLSGGVLVVAVAVSGLVAGRSLDSFLGVLDLSVYGFLAPMSVSFVTSFWVFLLFAYAYNGSRKQPYKIQAGWHPDRLIEAADEGDGLTEIQRSTIHGVSRWFKANQDVIEKASNTRRNGTNLLFTAGASLAIALIYAVGASIS